MRHSIRLSAVAAAVLSALAAAPAEARCTRLAFSVNDYGKDGPTKDAKGLLDKYVAKWAADHGIKTFTIGKKDVSCELFLDFGVFDEHTCKAAATVCWPDGQATKAYLVDKPEGAAPAAKPPAAPKAKPKPTEAKAAAAAPVAAATPAGAATPAVAAPVAVAPVAGEAKTATGAEPREKQ